MKIIKRNLSLIIVVLVLLCLIIVPIIKSKIEEQQNKEDMSLFDAKTFEENQIIKGRFVISGDYMIEAIGSKYDISFHNLKTGYEGPFCLDSDCSHETYDCAALHKPESSIMLCFFYNNKLYQIAESNNELIIYAGNNQGTEVEKVASSVSNNPFIKEIIKKDDSIYIVTSCETREQYEVPNSGGVVDVVGKVRVYCYNLKKNELVMIYESGKGYQTSGSIININSNNLVIEDIHFETPYWGEMADPNTGEELIDNIDDKYVRTTSVVDLNTLDINKLDNTKGYGFIGIEDELSYFAEIYKENKMTGKVSVYDFSSGEQELVKNIQLKNVPEAYYYNCTLLDDMIAVADTSSPYNYTMYDYEGNIVQQVNNCPSLIMTRVNDRYIFWDGVRYEGVVDVKDFPKVEKKFKKHEIRRE